MGSNGPPSWLPRIPPSSAGLGLFCSANNVPSLPITEIRAPLAGVTTEEQTIVAEPPLLKVSVNVKESSVWD